MLVAHIAVRTLYTPEALVVKTSTRSLVTANASMKHTRSATHTSLKGSFLDPAQTHRASYKKDTQIQYRVLLKVQEMQNSLASCQVGKGI